MNPLFLYATGVILTSLGVASYPAPGGFYDDIKISEALVACGVVAFCTGAVMQGLGFL